MINGTLLDLLKTTAPIDSSGLNVETKFGKSSNLLFLCHNVKILQPCKGKNKIKTI